MTEYIDRALAITAMQKLEDDDIETYGCLIQEGFHADNAIKALKALPATDVVEVVRCVNCRFYTRKDGAFYNGYCNKMEYCLIDNDDGFCSFAERREDAIISH